MTREARFARLRLAAVAIGAAVLAAASLVPDAAPPALAWAALGLVFAALIWAGAQARARETRIAEHAASEARYRSLVEGHGDVIFRRTPDGRLSFVNPAFRALFGEGPEVSPGALFLPETDGPSARGLIGRRAGGPRAAVAYDQHVRTRAGWRWIAWEDAPIRDGAGRLVEIQTSGRDVTAAKQLEADLRAALERAEDASRAKLRFLAAMSHEIRTPMNGVLGMARLLLESDLKPDQRTYAGAIRTSGEALLAIIDDILDLAQAESGAVRLEAVRFDPRAAVESVVELLSPKAQAKGLEIAAAIAPDAPQSVTGDPHRLRQILMNLAGNAVKFTEAGGVLVELGTGPGGVTRVRVHDTGIGVPADKQAAIFEEFTQADAGHARRFGGSGLGLAISRRLAAAMGGMLRLESTPGSGSTFTLAIPFPETEPASPGSVPRPAGVRLISPSPAVVLGLARALEGLNATLRCEWHGLAPGEIVLADSAAPGIAEIGAAARAAGAHAIVLVHPQDRGRLPALREAGFAHYLVKPVRREALMRRIAAALSGRETAAPERAVEAAAPGASEDALDILLVEDNPINAMLATAMLTKRGHRVTHAEDGAAALDRLHAHAYDLVLMDVQMPGMDGIEATRTRRAAEAQGGLPRTPVVALTAGVLDSEREACLAAGMDEMLTKPLDPAALDAALARIAAARQDRAA